MRHIRKLPAVRKTFLFLSILFTVLWLVLSLYSFSDNLNSRIVGVSLDKLVHLAAFAFFTLLYYCTLKSGWSNPLIKAAVIASGLGIVTEVLQLLLPVARYFEFSDLIFNTLGVIAAMLGIKFSSLGKKKAANFPV